MRSICKAFRPVVRADIITSIIMLSSIPVCSQPCIPTILWSFGSDPLNDPILPLWKAPWLQTSSSTWKCCHAQNKKATALPVAKEIRTGDTASTVGRLERTRFKDTNDTSIAIESVPSNTRPSTDTPKNKGNVCSSILRTLASR